MGRGRGKCSGKKYRERKGDCEARGTRLGREKRGREKKDEEGVV